MTPGAQDIGGKGVADGVRWPRITVITPSLNQATFLEQTIESVLGQEYPNLEYMIFDGGSTDGSVEIIRRYEGRLAHWSSEKDRGQSHAINKGLERATGEIVAYLNSDDLYAKGALRTVAECFIAHPEADLFHGRCGVVDAAGARIGERFGSIARYDEIIDLWDVWWKERNFVQPEVFWTRRITNRIGPLREDLHRAMDYEYWTRILRAGGTVIRTDSELACFRMQPNQKSGRPGPSVDELLRVVQPLIWERDRRVPWSKRVRLKGRWTFDAIFRRAADGSLERRESRWRRWLLLTWLTVRHPILVFVPGFWQRIGNALSLRGLQ